jgi:hypothetical protein
LAYEVFAAASISVVAALAYGGIRIQSEANDWRLNHMNEFRHMQNKITSRFHSEVIRFVQAVGQEVKSLEEIQRVATQLKLTDRIKELSDISVEMKELTDNYEAITRSRRKEGGGFLLMAVFAAINSALLIATGDTPIYSTDANGAFSLAPPILILIVVDLFAAFFGLQLKDHHDTHNEKMDWFAKKIREDNIVVGRTQESTVPTDDGLIG